MAGQVVHARLGRVGVDRLTGLQGRPSRIRNICVLAHVDHGKTTMSDALIASNGLIHPKMVGKLRYLDSRDDEQLRCITMKSSSISLLFQHQLPGQDENDIDYLINLIDSPGHVDFCSEVSTAVRLSDGAIVLVDAVEGVCMQTHAVLRQGWQEKLEMCLVFNKIDRLIVELKLSPQEAYDRIKGILGEVNNIINGFRSEKYMSDVDAVLAHTEAAHTEELEEDEEDAFSPAQGNVIFASAVDGWGFRIEQFAELYAAKLGASSAALRRALWGDYYFNPKTKMIVGKKAAGGKLKPMFPQFLFEPIWKVYNSVLEGADFATLDKLVKALGITIADRDLKHSDPRVVIQAVLSKWLPLSDAVLATVVERLPSPEVAQETRLLAYFPSSDAVQTSPSDSELAEIRSSVVACNTSQDAPTVAFVAKMFAVDRSSVPRHSVDAVALEGEDSTQTFIGFARVFSGLLRKGQRLHVLLPKYNPDEPDKHREEVIIGELYLMMGRALEPVAEVPAGNLVGVGGLGQKVLKTATLSSSMACRPFVSMKFPAAAIVAVAVEPANPNEWPPLIQGLRLLNRADPFVEVTVQETGEHVVKAAGEVHLERCLKDLRERFARIELAVSAPLVSFRESVNPEVSEAALAAAPWVTTVTSDRRCTVRARATPLPPALTAALQSSGPMLRTVFDQAAGASVCQSDEAGAAVLANTTQDSISVLTERLQEAALDTSAGQDWRHNLSKISSLGPRRTGPNILLSCDMQQLSNDDAGSEARADETSSAICCPPVVSQLLGLTDTGLRAADVSESAALMKDPKAAASGSSKLALDRNVHNSIVTGFQLTCAAGPLCEEPLSGVAFEVMVQLHNTAGDEDGYSSSGSSAVQEQNLLLSGQIITEVRDACRQAMLKSQPRLVEAMYLCEVMTNAEALGKVYGVLGKRRSRIISEEMREGSGLFTVHAYLPVAESFGFADELRRSTSGAASPQLEDPFFVPTTVDELEEFGDGVSIPHNLARRCMDAVRRRKGLPVEEKVVEHAEKQRTLARKV
eukprot:jgi/Chlat1/7882/Chrsp66S00582